jgi:hypothetical protein
MVGVIECGGKQTGRPSATIVRPSLARRLLNTASIVCLVLCVALMGMWVRSYYWLDELRGPCADGRLFGITSMSGQLVVSAWPPGLSNSSPSRAWLWATEANPKSSPTLRGLFPPMEFARHAKGSSAVVNVITYWFLVLILGFGSSAMICQMRWPLRQFSLRTLLIAMTLAAVVLGMIAWLDHSWIEKRLEFHVAPEMPLGCQYAKGLYLISSNSVKPNLRPFVKAMGLSSPSP